MSNKNKSLRDKLKEGYSEMAQLNLELAEEGVNGDNEALSSEEEKLMESE